MLVSTKPLFFTLFIAITLLVVFAPAADASTNVEAHRRQANRMIKKRADVLGVPIGAAPDPGTSSTASATSTSASASATNSASATGKSTAASESQTSVRIYSLFVACDAFFDMLLLDRLQVKRLPALRRVHRLQNRLLAPRRLHLHRPHLLPHPRPHHPALLQKQLQLSRQLLPQMLTLLRSKPLLNLHKRSRQLRTMQPQRRQLVQILEQRQSLAFQRRQSQSLLLSLPPSEVLRLSGLLSASGSSGHQLNLRNACRCVTVSLSESIT